MIRNLVACAAMLSFIFAIGTIGIGAQNVHPIAPTIEQLPSVIIGDGGDVSGSGETARHLFRYMNIMNLATSHKIKWNNADLGFGDAQKHAYYISTPTGAIQTSTDQRLVSELTYADIAALQAAGIKPAAAKQITDGDGRGGISDFFWLSLANNVSHATNSINAYNANPSSNGETLADFAPHLAPAVVTLVLVDGDFPTTAVAQTDFTVYTVPGAEDGFSGASVKVYDANFDPGSEGWVYKTLPSGTGFSPAISAVTGGALTMCIGTNSGNIYFGTWTSGKPGSAEPQTVIPANESTMRGNIYRATFTLTSTAANAKNTPGFRLFYQSAAFTHVGGLSYDSWDMGIGSSIIAPSAGNPKDFVVYWAVPFVLSGYGDTDKLATLQSGKDLRDYFLNFDMIGYESTDTGILGLDNVLVEMIPRPKLAKDLVTWGKDAKAFNSSNTTDGWVADHSALFGQIPPGLAIINSNTIALSAVHYSSSMGYQKIGVFANATALPPWQSGKLVRTNLDISSSAVNFTPNFRVLTMASRTSGVMLPMLWVDSFSPYDAQNLWSPASAGAAASPLTTGSRIETYLWTHTAPMGADAGVLDPQIDCYAIYKRTGEDAQGNKWEWPLGNARLTISKFQYEECVLD